MSNFIRDLRSSISHSTLFGVIFGSVNCAKILKPLKYELASEKSVLNRLKMGQTWPLFCLLSYFHNAKTIIAQCKHVTINVVCLGFEPGVVVWKAQTNLLSNCVTPKFWNRLISCYVDRTLMK